MKPVFNLFRTAADFALPPRCPGCGVVVDGDHRFCLECWNSLDFLSGTGCAGCGRPIEGERIGELLCGACLAQPPSHDGVRAAVAYGETARKLVLKLKYAGKPAMAEIVARQLGRHIDRAEGGLIVPVPLHRWRIWSRGYNQSALIAGSLARMTNLPVVTEALLRTRATQVLRGLGANARAKAVRGAFAVAPAWHAEICGKTIWLVDDVYTSGATANACAAALKKAGASRVILLCWARVLHDEY